MQNRPLVVGNWKMNSRKQAAIDLVDNIENKLNKELHAETVICPPYVYMETVHGRLTQSTLGGQNVFYEEQGAFTGEISPGMLIDIGCKWVIVGHSERRSHLKEDNETCAKKFIAAHNAGLKPIFCIGESLEEKKANKTMDVLIEQLDSLLAKSSVNLFEDAVLAYEPIWAIGTGVTATKEEAESVHQQLRNYLAGFDNTVAKSMRIIYGGSVKPENALELIEQPNINGFLVGGASLKSDDFVKICELVG